MQQYLDVYESIPLNNKAKEIFQGKLEIPDYSVETPPNLYGFPPALIPIWSIGEGPIYYGYWKHWFTNSREITIVKMFLESDYQVKEIARNFDQLLRIFCLEYICAIDEVDEEITHFADQLNIDDLKEIEEMSSKTGDDPIGLIKLKNFGKDSPVICYEDTKQYIKDFPHINMECDEYRVSNICGLEVYDELYDKVKNISYCPKWLLDFDKLELFNDFLDRNELRNAWMTLNSNGWNFSDSKIAIEKLAKKANDTNFNLLAKAWSSLPHERFGGY